MWLQELERTVPIPDRFARELPAIGAILPRLKLGTTCTTTFIHAKNMALFRRC